MERSLKEIIKEVGKEYEMEDEVINDIIKRLQKEFYVKLKHMKNLTIDTWKFLGLPINLYYVINELYQSALNEQQGSLPHPEQPKNVNNVINEKKSYNPPPPQYQSQKQSQMINNNYQKAAVLILNYTVAFIVVAERKITSLSSEFLSTVHSLIVYDI